MKISRFRIRPPGSEASWFCASARIRTIEEATAAREMRREEPVRDAAELPAAQ